MSRIWLPILMQSYFNGQQIDVGRLKVGRNLIMAFGIWT